jgi:hypothetical protein
MNYGPKTVTNGLVLCLDAADKNSYPGSGTTWTDLTGNGNNGTLTNGPSFNSTNAGAISFDGTDDYSILTRNIFTNTLPNFTISIWYRKTGDGTLFGNHYNYNNWESVWFSTSYFIVNAASNDTTNRQTLSYTATQNSATRWHNLVAVNNSSSNYMKVFLNGQELATKSATVVPWNSTVPPTIGANRDFSTGGILYPLIGNISNIQVYNRAITTQEINQNYNATKSRFGL